jgi:hypothetical protein
MLLEVLFSEVPQEIDPVSGLPERTARTILSQLLEEKILVADMPKGPVRLALPTHLAGFLFPDLYPPQLTV